MSSSNPPASGVRVEWEDVPAAIRAAIEERAGARVTESNTRRGGFSPGLAAELSLEDGRRIFVKAVSEAANPDSPRMHRREANIVASLPAAAPVPRLLWVLDDGGWVGLGFEYVDGVHPAEPWRTDEVQLVVKALGHMAELLTPSPIEWAGQAAARFDERGISGWRLALASHETRLDPWAVAHLSQLADLEALAQEASGGDTLLHFDTRADNILISRDRVWVVDWPSACIGAPWIDWVAMAPSVAMQGGPEPDEFLRMFGPTGASDEEVNAVICALAGYFTVRALQPPPPGIPTVRAFQAAQGKVAVEWLRGRVGW